jgi:hypothetical protein
MRSRRAGERVLARVERFLNQCLKQTFNREKSHVARPWVYDYLAMGWAWAGLDTGYDKPAWSLTFTAAYGIVVCEDGGCNSASYLILAITALLRLPSAR